MAKAKSDNKFICELCGEEKSALVKTKDGDLCETCRHTLDPQAKPDPKAAKRTANELKELIVEQAVLLQARKELGFTKMFKLVLELKGLGK